MIQEVKSTVKIAPISLKKQKLKYTKNYGKILRKGIKGIKKNCD